jgi:hypothetical protein
MGEKSRRETWRMEALRSMHVAATFTERQGRLHKATGRPGRGFSVFRKTNQPNPGDTPKHNSVRVVLIQPTNQLVSLRTARTI